jgi:antitoxin CcdA
MKQKLIIELDVNLISFLDCKANGNRSSYLNNLLAQQRRQEMEVQLIKALEGEASDPEYQSEIALWDCTVGDGLDEWEANS